MPPPLLPEVLELKHRLNEIMAKHTGQTVETIDDVVQQVLVRGAARVDLAGKLEFDA